MANDYRDRNRFDRDRDRDFYDRGDEPSRGMFGYEGEGYMHGGARDLDREYGGRDYGYNRNYDYDTRRDYGRDAGYRGGGFMGGDFGMGIPNPRPSYRGVGPKNYQRSDDRIREDVCERLAHDDYVDASDIEVTVSEGMVTLAGTVDDRGSKRRAEDIAESVRGVRDVQNTLRLQLEPAVQDTTGSEGGGTKMPRAPRR